MPADAATADGEHSVADPFGRRGSGGVSDIADLHHELAGRRHLVYPSRFPIGAFTSGRSLDCHRIKLRQVSFLHSPSISD